MSRRPVVYLIDANAYVYRAFFALPPLTNRQGVPVNAVYGFTTMLLKLLRQTRPEYIAAVFDSPGPTFRSELFEAYKANRTAMPDEMKAQLPAVREVAEAAGLPILMVPGVEADDVIATLAQRVVARGFDLTVITSDKDLMQLVGDHVQLWDTMRDRRVDVEAVRARFGVAPEQVIEMLGLMGDSIDNIPGIKGVGEKTAQALIQRYGTIERLLESLDELEQTKEIRGAKKLAANLRENADTARLSRDLATVRRDVPIDTTVESLRYGGLDPAVLRPVFTRFGFESLLKDVAGEPVAVESRLRHGVDAAAWTSFAAGVRGSGQLALGCLQSEQGELTGAVIGTAGEDAVALDRPSEPERWAELEGWLRETGIVKIAHDLKRDLRLLDPAVATDLQPAFDVMIASYVLESTSGHRIEQLASEVLGQQLAEYRRDEQCLGAGVAVLPPLYDQLARQIADRGMTRLFHEIEMPLVTVLADMERRGMLVDVAILEEIGREIAATMVRLEREIYELAGGPFNIGSPPQLREVLFERLQLSTKGVKRGKTGLSTDVDVLTKLAEEHPLPAKILEHRALSKIRSTYIEALPQAVRAATGRVHTTFNQAVAATGRLSSTDPNLQNIPIRTDYGRRIRAAFIAGPGNVLIGADYSQIELRVLAHLSGDPVLVRAFTNDEDIHAATAAQVFGGLPGMVTPEMRRIAKVINFGIIYGMGPQRLARELGISFIQADRYIRDYFERYAGVKAYMDGVREQAKATGYVMTLLGRRRTLPDLSSRDRALVQAAERTATNTPIQGTAADLIKLAMVAIHRRLRQEGLRAGLVLQVHDELLVESVEADADQVLAVIRTEMEQVYPLSVPLRVDSGIGPNWAEIH